MCYAKLVAVDTLEGEVVVVVKGIDWFTKDQRTVRKSQRMSWLCLASEHVYLSVDIGCRNSTYGFLRYFNYGLGTVSVDIDVFDTPLFVRAEASYLPFRDKVFGCVVGGELLEHCWRFEETIAEMARLSNYVLLTFPAEKYWNKEWIKESNPKWIHVQDDLKERLDDAYQDTLYHVDELEFEHIYHVRGVTPVDVMEVLKTIQKFKTLVGLIGVKEKEGKTVRDELPSWGMAIELING
jgi:hypothetical protein